jgi:hypothetical protein
VVNDLISTKCSFLNLATSNNVSSKAILASATESDASFASLVASSYCFVAIASSLATYFCY